MLARWTYTRTWSLVLGALVVSGALGFGCAAIQRGATPDELSRAKSQAERGAKLFENECARCHGPRGEGVGTTPFILGQGALPAFPRDSSMSDPSMTDPQLIQIEAQARPAGAASRDPFHNAQDVYTFINTRMPKDRPGKLRPVDSWALVNFLFAAQGANLPTGGIGPQNATSIAIPRR